MYVFNLTLCFQVSSMLLVIYQYYAPFYGQIVFCCMDIPWVCEWMELNSNQIRNAIGMLVKVL